MISCAAEIVFRKEMNRKFIGTPRYVAINRGGVHGIDTKTPVYALADDPLKVHGCKLALVEYLEGSLVSVRYRTRDIFQLVEKEISYAEDNGLSHL